MFHSNHASLYNCRVPDNSPTKFLTLPELLRASPWAASLTAAEMAQVEANVIERNVPTGSFVCRKGEPVDYWFGVIDGLLKVSSDIESGKTATLIGVPPGGWFGEGSVMKDEKRRYDSIALRDSRVAFMPRSTFHWLLDHSIGFNRYLLNQLNERLGQFIGLLESERLLDIDARVARCLATLFNPLLYPGSSRTIAVSQEELGYLTGVSRQRVNRSLKVLQFAGYLSVEYGSITIQDLDGLRRFGG